MTSEMLQLYEQQQVPRIATSIPTSPSYSQDKSDLKPEESMKTDHFKMSYDPSPINKLDHSDGLSTADTTIQQIKVQPTFQALSSELLIEIQKSFRMCILGS